MKVILLLLLAAALYGTPVLLFETAVMPELEQLKQTYANADAIARGAAGL